MPNWNDYYQHPVPLHELIAGLMLGLSSGNINSWWKKYQFYHLHIWILRLVCLAVPEFGLGFPHFASCKNNVLERLYSELEYQPRLGHTLDVREDMALSAGFSLAPICAGFGSSVFDVTDCRKIHLPTWRLWDRNICWRDWIASWARWRYENEIEQ